jgi:hypothetical protein
LVDALVGADEPIRRARVSMGDLREEIVKQLTWEYQGTMPTDWGRFCPYAISFNIGPTTYDSDDVPDSLLLGWMCLGFSGPGYFYPWKPAECIERISSIPEIVRAMDLCRATFPVHPIAPSREIRQTRQIMQRTTAWPHPSVDIPLDWCWGAGGCGA